MEIEDLCITYVKFICLLFINLLNAAACLPFFGVFFFFPTEFMKHVGPNNNNSYGTVWQSQMTSCGPLIVRMEALPSAQVTKVNVSSSMVHGTPVFLEIYQSYGCGAI